MKCDELKDKWFNAYPEIMGIEGTEPTKCYGKDDVDAAIAECQEKILVLEKSYKKLVKKFVHESSVAESYRSLIYKEDALKYQEAGNSEMYDELSKISDNAYRRANRWRTIFRKMSQEGNFRWSQVGRDKYAKEQA